MTASAPSPGTFLHTREMDAASLFTRRGPINTHRTREIHFHSLPLRLVRKSCIMQADPCVSCIVLNSADYEAAVRYSPNLLKN